MAVTVKRFQELEGRINRLQRDLNKAEGAYDELMKRLKKEHGCSDLDEAEAKLKKMNEKVDKEEKAFEVAMREFEEEWGGVLDGSSAV